MKNNNSDEFISWLVFDASYSESKDYIVCIDINRVNIVKERMHCSMLIMIKENC